MHNKIALAASITKGLEYLAANQQTDGSFISYLDLDPRVQKTDKPIKTVFIPSLMLASLSNITSSEALPIREKLAQFLLSQKSNQWTFNFLAEDEPQRYIRNYPDDLDDTFCAYTALYLHSSQLITTDILVHMTKALLITEAAVGGPYKTWLAPADSDKVWLDVDPAVNCNILYFLNLVTTPPEKLLRYIEHDVVIPLQFNSPYYVPFYPIAYYVSRSYAGTHKHKILNAIQEKNDNTPLSVLACALSISSILRLSAHADLCQTYVQQLLDSQNSDGSWPSEAFCTDEKKSAGLYYNGCAALTTAFALEALALYRQANKDSAHLITPSTQTPPLSSPKKYSSHSLLPAIQQDISCFEEPLRHTLEQTLLKTIRAKDAHEITHFAHSFNQSLHAPLKNQTAFLDKLGLANLYGWTAYTIYDDFLDDEGKPLLLSSANAALRLSYEYFLNAIPKKEFQSQVRTLFGLIDAANTWEIMECRYEAQKHRSITIAALPNYSDLAPLAHRSIGHALAPLAVLYKSGASTSSNDFQAVYTALKKYIIIKQLNDDAHDWQEDFLHGRITYVVATILKELAVTPGTYKFNHLFPVMQRHFWYHTLTTICEEMEQQLRLSRQALATCSAIKHTNTISGLLDTIEASLQETLAKQAQTKTFLEHF